MTPKIDYLCYPQWMILEMNIAHANVMMTGSSDMQLVDDLTLANAIRYEMLKVWYN